MALSAAALKTAIFNSIKTKLDLLFADPESPPTRDAVWTDIADAIATEVVDHIVANLEIKGVTVDLETSLVAIFGSGTAVAEDGGAALQSAWGTASEGKTGVQSDDGTGHVA